MIVVGLLLAAASVAPDSTPAAARTVVERYYAALEQHRYRRAYASWAGDGRASGQTYAGFVRGFARTAHTRVTTGRPRDQEGAAGSLFVTVPVTVSAMLKDGTRQRFRGSYVLRRVNDVPGASATQLRWHIASAKLTPS